MPFTCSYVTFANLWAIRNNQFVFLVFHIWKIFMWHIEQNAKYIQEILYMWLLTYFGLLLQCRVHMKFYTMSNFIKLLLFCQNLFWLSVSKDMSLHCTKPSPRNSLSPNLLRFSCSPRFIHQNKVYRMCYIWVGIFQL
jgi:hypothetical protein